MRIETFPMEQNTTQELNLVVLPNGRLHLEWMDTRDAVTKSSRLLQKEIYERFSDNNDLWLLFLGFSDSQIPLPPSLDYWRHFSGSFAKKLVQTPDLEALRHRVRIPAEEEELETHLNRAPMMTGVEYLRVELLEALWTRLNKAFSLAIQSHEGPVEDFIKAYSPNVHLVGRVFFHLVENRNDEYPFAFMATYTTGLNRQGKSKHLPLKHALQEYGNDDEKLLELLTTVHIAEKRSPLIGELLETGELFHPLAWTPGEAFTFLKEIPVYEEAGILCRIPNWWKGNRAGVRLNFSLGDKKPSLAGMDAILSFDVRLFLGDARISEAEARRLLAESDGLAFLKNRWVAVDREKLAQTLDAYEKAKGLMEEEGLSLRDAMRMQLMPERFLGLSPREIDHGVSNGEWLESVIRKLADPSSIPPVSPRKAFKAVLRNYQKNGLNWLHFLHSLKFGACLADDMGLGKTVQVLGFLSTIKSDLQKTGNSNKASLLVIPASLISNWDNEIKRFSPDTRFFVAHPSADLKKSGPPKDQKALDAFDLVITTYALIQRYSWLQTHAWNYIILDEAQAIKNPGTKQARAVKKLISSNRIIMTGTPIENRLSDLWSLFDFLNPGLLGNAGEFKKFTKDLGKDPSGYARLRNIISPYILRRLKTDKSVISDHPEKVEMKSNASLCRKQVLLYGNMVQDIRKSIEETEGIQRRGLMLSSLI
ncbi:MAG: DEAD/DEAH box helicase [Pseudomonadota bacterium]